MKTVAKRHLITEALALNLGYQVDGKTGTVDGVDIRDALARVDVHEVAPTRRVGLGAVAGGVGFASFGLLGAPLVLLGLKRKDQSSVTITLTGSDDTRLQPAPRTFTGKQRAQAIRFAGRVNAQK
jgi:hypothetical protein